MKFSILAAFFLLSTFLSPASRAQGAQRHPSTRSAASGANGFDLSDRLASVPARSAIDPNPASPAVSIPASQLRIPAKALKEFERAQKSFRSGDVPASAGHLRKAVEIYPDFFQAHNLLGYRYVSMGKFEEGLSEYRQALAIDPFVGEAYHNLAVALFFVKRYPEAEQAARHALDLMPNETATRYVLARALVQQAIISPETIHLLHQSEEKFPNASLVLAQIFFEKGETDATASALRNYLRTPQPDNKQPAECWLAHLTNQLATNCFSTGYPPSFK